MKGAVLFLLSSALFFFFPPPPLSGADERLAKGRKFLLSFFNARHVETKRRPLPGSGSGWRFFSQGTEPPSDLSAGIFNFVRDNETSGLFFLFVARKCKWASFSLFPCLTSWARFAGPFQGTGARAFSCGSQKGFFSLSGCVGRPAPSIKEASFF